MYLKEVSGVFTGDINYKAVSDNDKLNNFTIIIANKILKELQLYNLEYMESVCTAKEFNDLLEIIKSIWESEYSNYNIKFWRTESNVLFLNWLGVESFKDYC